MGNWEFLQTRSVKWKWRQLGDADAVLSESVEFAFLDNGAFTEAAGAPLREKVGTVVGTFPDAPAADALVPTPQ